MRKRQKAKLVVADMLRFSLGVTRMDRVRNENIRGTVDVRCFREKVSEHISRRMMRLELPCRRPRGRPKRRFMDEVKDMKIVGVREDDAEDGVRWGQMIRCGDS